MATEAITDMVVRTCSATMVMDGPIATTAIILTAMVAMDQGPATMAIPGSSATVLHGRICIAWQALVQATTTLVLMPTAARAVQ